MISLPSCGCSEASVEGRVFTCSVCIAAAVRYWDGERVDQCEMFEYVDSPSSVRGLTETETDLTHISKVLKGLADADPFPF